MLTAARRAAAASSETPGARPWSSLQSPNPASLMATTDDHNILGVEELTVYPPCAGLSRPVKRSASSRFTASSRTCSALGGTSSAPPTIVRCVIARSSGDR